jgi:hypothetical protein
VIFVAKEKGWVGEDGDNVKMDFLALLRKEMMNVLILINEM